MLCVINYFPMITISKPHLKPLKLLFDISLIFDCIKKKSEPINPISAGQSKALWTVMAYPESDFGRGSSQQTFLILHKFSFYKGNVWKTNRLNSAKSFWRIKWDPQAADFGK